MRLKNSVLFDQKFYSALLKLSKLDLDLCHSIPLAKSIRDIRQEASLIFPIRDKIFSEFGVTRETLDTLNADDKEKLNSKIRELFETEFEITLDYKITLNEKQIKGKLSADDLLTLDEIVEY